MKSRVKPDLYEEAISRSAAANVEPQAPLDLNDLRSLAEEYERADEQIQAQKVYRQLLLSLIRHKIITGGKQSANIPGWEIRLDRRYFVACAVCHIDVRECVHSRGLNLNDPARSVQIEMDALDDPHQRWVYVKREKATRARGPRWLELVYDSEAV